MPRFPTPEKCQLKPCRKMASVKFMTVVFCRACADKVTKLFETQDKLKFKDYKF